MDITPLIVPITDFIRKTKYYSDLLPDVGTVTVTRDGRPYMDIKLNNIERNRRLLKFAGTWKGTSLDNDKLWDEILNKRVNRKKPITL